MKKIILLNILLIVTLYATPKENMDGNKIVQSLDNRKAPLYTPFVENYILNEIKALRDENRDLKVMVNTELAERELRVTDKAINYATSTMNNMFYIIAAASSILVLLGWNSLRDLNDRLKGMVDEKIQKVISGYEERMEKLEYDLSQRSQQVLKNQEEIARTNTIHSLWMRAGLETTAGGKIDIYDQILAIRPKDSEALSYKADAALEAGEAHWALSLSNRALAISPTNAYALFQRACAYSALGQADNALADLEKVLDENDQYIDDVLKEPEFDVIRNESRFVELLNKHKD